MAPMRPTNSNGPQYGFHVGKSDAGPSMPPQQWMHNGYSLQPQPTPYNKPHQFELPSDFNKDVVTLPPSVIEILIQNEQKMINAAHSSVSDQTVATVDLPPPSYGTITPTDHILVEYSIFGQRIDSSPKLVLAASNDRMELTEAEIARETTGRRNNLDVVRHLVTLALNGHFSPIISALWLDNVNINLWLQMTPDQVK